MCPVSNLSMKPTFSLAALLLVVVSLAVGQKAPARLPCSFSGGLLQTANGKTVQFTSDEMKHRATRRVDVSDSMKQVDIKGTVITELLVGTSGNVVCVKTLNGHPIIRAEVEKALRSWTFEPATAGGQPVANLGRMQFTLCNISCGKGEFSMTIVK